MTEKSEQERPFSLQAECNEATQKKSVLSQKKNESDSEKALAKTKFSLIHFSSVNPNWRTPTFLYEELDKEFQFNYDPCPIPSEREINGIDGLFSEWGKRNFVNPPYSHNLIQWIKKGYDESLKGKLVVFLIPARTDTKWFHEYCSKGEIRFIRGRLKFQGAKYNAPFPSMIVIFRGDKL